MISLISGIKKNFDLIESETKMVVTRDFCEVARTGEMLVVKGYKVVII